MKYEYYVTQFNVLKLVSFRHCFIHFLLLFLFLPPSFLFFPPSFPFSSSSFSFFFTFPFPYLLPPSSHSSPSSPPSSLRLYHHSSFLYSLSHPGLLLHHLLLPFTLPLYTSPFLPLPLHPTPPQLVSRS